MSQSKLRPIHPFPARMAPSIALRRLGGARKKMRVLDPMLGSGTTTVAARLRGHKAFGFDTDPLALLIAKSWSSDVNPKRFRKLASEVLLDARKRYQDLAIGDAYPAGADEETKAFIRFWFDSTNRRQLTALAQAISKVRHLAKRTLLWCAFSRLIITKRIGASLAMDVSHSRPHKKYRIAPVKPFDRFLASVETILKNSPFSSGRHRTPLAKIRKGDARDLPLDSGSIDLVITSPPYLNAIDYLRGHKLSLVWMGHWIKDLRELRSQSVGAECSLDELDDDLKGALRRMGDTASLPERIQAMLKQYLEDMDKVFAEISRVLRKHGEAVVVIGDSTIKGIFIRNSSALVFVARRNGLTLRSRRRRPLLVNRRYLPPPNRRISGKKLRTRMREEVLLTFRKAVANS